MHQISKLYRSFVCFAPVALALPFSAAVSAQELLETLVVRGERSTHAVDARVLVQSSADFQAGARFDPAELMLAIPGLQVDSRSNYAQDTRLSLRGFGARSAFGVRGIELQVDGVPLSTPDGQGQLSSVMFDNIASVQLIRGPIAALYGNGAGGVLALQTTRPEHNQLSLGLAGGDPGLERQTLQGDWRSGQLAAGVQLTNSQLEGERPHAQAERRQGAAQIFYTSDNQLELSIKHERSDDPLLQDPLALSPEEWRVDPLQTNVNAERFNTRKSVAHEQTSISLRSDQGASRWQTSIWQGERAITQYLGFTGDALTSSGGVVDLGRDFAGASGTFSQAFSLFNLAADVSLGAEFAQSEDRRRGYVNNNGVAGDLRRDELGEVKSRDLYGLLQLTPWAQFSLFAGARQSRLDMAVEDYFVNQDNPDDSGARDFSEQSYAFGANYQLSQHWQLFASRGRGFETPTLTEMAYRRTSGNASDSNSGLNINLEAAINYQSEWGLRFQPQAELSLELIQYQIASQNELVVDQSVGGRTSYRNASATERDGLELLGRYSFSPQWRLVASAQQLDAVYSAGDLTGKQLPGVAREEYQLGLQWLPLGTEQLVLSANGRQRGRVFTSDANDIYASAYRTLDLSAAGNQALGQLNLAWWLKLANLSDENYVGAVVVNQANGRAFEPALGRNFSAGINLAFSF